VHYASGIPNNLFGLSRRASGSLSLQLHGEASLFSERSSLVRDTLIQGGHPQTMRSILTTAPLEDVDRQTYRKPDFIFGDAAPDPDRQLQAGEGQWIFQLDGEKSYLPSTKRHFPLSSFAAVTQARKMAWSVSRSTESVHVGRLSYQSGYSGAGPPRSIMGLYPGKVSRELPVGENPAVAQTFGAQFCAVGGNYPATDFRTPGWVHPPKTWWAELTNYVLANFGKDLEKLNLHEAVRATCYGIDMKVACFYAILELYCPASGTFFTPVGELGMALHEMWEISALPFGSLPYEEYFPCEAELALLEKQEPALLETYRELMCHLHICSSIHTGGKSSSKSLKSWGNYLFPDMKSAPEAAHCGVAEGDILARMEAHAEKDIVVTEDDGPFEEGDVLRSFHHQARRPMSRKALLAGFLTIWLKKCVVPSSSGDIVHPNVLLPAVRLVHGHRLGLLPAMVCCIQRGLRALTEAFCRPSVSRRGKGAVLPCDGPNPRVGLPYTYLMAWFALHCPALIGAGADPPQGVRTALLRRFEGCSWQKIYVAEARKLVRRYDAYSLFRCFPRMRDAGFNEEFHDAESGDSPMSRGVFEWLVSIRPSHLLFRSGDTCYLEPYVPSRFARQFGYDQLYVGNPNPDLNFMGSLIDGARAWQFFTADGTGARLRTPLRDPGLRTTLCFCQWYAASNSTPPGFNANSSGVRLIAHRMRQKASEKKEGKRVRVPGIEEFIAVDDSEASDAGSPRFEVGTGADVREADTCEAGSGVVGTAPPRHVEEVEEEDSDVHFKRKRGSGSRRKSLAKKPRRHAPTIVVEGEPSTALPSAAPLVAEPSVAEPTTGKIGPI